METLFFKKVAERTNQRFYHLSIPVTNVPNKQFNFEDERQNFNSRLNKEYKYLTPSKIEFVCVSDAHTHVERLVFVAVQTKDSEFYNLCGLQIDGRHTMMIEGGDQRHVHPDEVYLRRIASANGYKFGML